VPANESDEALALLACMLSDHGFSVLKDPPSKSPSRKS
jgi:hypothetical protein